MFHSLIIYDGSNPGASAGTYPFHQRPFAASALPLRSAQGFGSPELRLRAGSVPWRC